MAKPTHFSILATSFAGGPRPRNAAMILSGLWLLIFFASLFAPPLLDDADATHAQAARSMAETGDLVTLHVDGLRYLEKAPLPYWLAALSFSLFGFNTFAAHLPQALAVALLVLLGHRWANQAFGARTAFYTSIALLTSLGVFLFTRILIPDILLSLCLAASLFAFLKSLTPVELGVLPPLEAIREPVILSQARSAKSKDPDDLRPPSAFRSSSTSYPDLSPHLERPAIAWYAGPLFYPYVMWSTLALAVLAKGLVALIFFFASTLAFLLLTDDLRHWRRLRPVSGLLLFLAIGAPWHILAGLRNQGGAGGHGFFWFYFWNEHVLRFLGRRTPRDYNKLPGSLYWLQHLLWLFPWSLFLPLGFTALWRRLRHQTRTLTAHARSPYARPRHWGPNLSDLSLIVRGVALFGGAFLIRKGLSPATYAIIVLTTYVVTDLLLRRQRTGLTPSPFHRIDPQQRSILLLALFAAIVLLFFSLSTNQEYYTLPAYLPLLLLIAATITRAEQTYSTSPQSRRWIKVAHAALSTLGALTALALAYGLWSSRHLPFNPDIGSVLAHRAVAGYTLSTAHFFDLTAASFAALRPPAVLAALALTLGPALAWTLRTQRRHIAATTAIAFTSAGFLFAAQIAFARFAPLLSSKQFAVEIEQLQTHHRIAPDAAVLIFGDQAFGSSIPFYLGRPVSLVDGRSTSLLFGSSFPDAPPIFLTPSDLRRRWGHGARNLLFVPAERRWKVDQLLGPTQTILLESSGKLLLTDRPLNQQPSELNP